MAQEIIDELKSRHSILVGRITKLETQQNGGYTAQVARSFHLGMVGGSGRNVSKLNRRRGAELDRTIDRAVVLTKLYAERNTIEAKIKDLENDGPAKRAAKKEERNRLMAEWWKQLKVGDDIAIRRDPVLITKKNAKSCETGSGCKWTAKEIIGKEAAALL